MRIGKIMDLFCAPSPADGVVSGPATPLVTKTSSLEPLSDAAAVHLSSDALDVARKRNDTSRSSVAARRSCDSRGSGSEAVSILPYKTDRSQQR